MSYKTRTGRRMGAFIVAALLLFALFASFAPQALAARYCDRCDVYYNQGHHHSENRGHHSGEYRGHHSGGYRYNSSSAVSSDSLIGKQAAREIALEHAGATAASVKKYDIGLKRGGCYEIEFVCGGMEYEYRIDGYTGEILSWDKEKD